MKKNYNVQTTTRTALPRSKRLKEAGAAASPSSSAGSSGKQESASGSSCDGHSHANKLALDAITIDDLFYLWLRQKIEGESESQLQKVKAGYADHAGDAEFADEAGNAVLWDEHEFADWLNQSVRTGDTVQFAQVIAAILRSPDFASGIETGTGWKIGEKGDAEMTSLVLRSFLKVPQLIYNKVSVTGGEMWNTEGGTIADVQKDPASETAYILTMDVEDGDTIELAVDDICKGHYNSNAGFITSYFRVTDVDQAAKTIRIVLGADGSVPGGINHPPVPFMNIARYGNFTNEERQSSQYFSSNEQRITLLSGVDQYIITPQHHKVVIGSIPEALIPRNLPIQGKPSIYLDNVLAKNFFQLDKSGAVVKTIRDRGLWSAETASSDPYRCTDDTQDDVYHNSCKYRCIVDGTLQEPRFDATDWLLIAGDTSLSLDIESTAGETFLFGHLSTTLIATVKRGVNDITDTILPSDWSWTRETGDVQADAIWNADHSSCGRQIELGNEDLIALSGCFICRAYVRDSGDTLSMNIEF